MTVLVQKSTATHGRNDEQDLPTERVDSITTLAGPHPYDDIIILADILDDMEAIRVANENRYRTLTRTDEWGKGVPETQVLFVKGTVDNLGQLEHQVVLELQRAVRRSPLGGFAKATTGLGEKSLGRLIGSIGDPAWHYRENRPRTLRELNAYCGMHVWERPNLGVDVSPKRHLDSPDSPLAHSHGGSTQTSVGGGELTEGGDSHPSSDDHLSSGVAPFRSKGHRANWSGDARKTLWLIAQSMKKNRTSAYRSVYDAARVKYAEAVHSQPCVRCGPSGSPAPTGSPLSDGHKDGRADRLVAKAFLKDLWREARQVG